ncbi:MAG: CDP-diacylglycerol--glycerol-3-phosphate 3-phosphatidyltransferase [Gemmatimonadetes bacterium]|nr:CDP-diacylglycerol--glycerol-3-phosphate 3-phosphatidyltransferase [Gemmatimonadota bacterium]
MWCSPALPASLSGEIGLMRKLRLFFVVAALTDWLDGFLARRWRQTSALGTLLDPIADKLLVTSVILMLVAFDRAPLFASLVILCRELLVSGLREYLAEIRVSVPVTPLAKWKTFIQMFSIGFLLIGEVGPVFFHPAVTTLLIGEVLIWIAAVLTMVTGYDYLRAGWRHIEEPLD